MANEIKKFNPENLDYTRIATSSNAALNQNFINENNIIKDYWVGDDGTVEIVDMGDGSYMISKDGVGMGFTDQEGFNSINGIDVAEVGNNDASIPSDASDSISDTVEHDTDYTAIHDPEQRKNNNIENPQNDLSTAAQTAEQEAEQMLENRNKALEDLQIDSETIKEYNDFVFGTPDFRDERYLNVLNDYVSDYITGITDDFTPLNLENLERNTSINPQKLKDGSSIFAYTYDGMNVEIHQYEDGTFTVDYKKDNQRIIETYKSGSDSSQLLNVRIISDEGEIYKIYDKNGNLISSEPQKINDIESFIGGGRTRIGGLFSKEYTTTTSAQGQLLHVHHYSDGNTTFEYKNTDTNTKYIYTYDKDSNLTKKEVLFNDGYPSDDTPIKSITYNYKNDEASASNEFNIYKNDEVSVNYEPNINYNFGNIEYTVKNNAGEDITITKDSYGNTTFVNKVTNVKKTYDLLTWDLIN